MNIPVKVELASFKGKVVEVMDDNLHFLLHEGQITYEQAVNALKEAGLELDKRFYPWLRDIENLKDGSFDLKKIFREEPKPDLLELPEVEGKPEKTKPKNNAEGAK